MTKQSEKAEGQSVSFKPGWLYHEAKRYAESLEPEKNVSEVICEFVRAGLTAAGWPLPESGPRGRRGLITPAEAKLIAECRALKIDVAAHLTAVIADASAGVSP